MPESNALRFYIDDSGSRHPDRKAPASDKHDWFALGGVLVHESDREPINSAIEGFRMAWPQMGDAPLHSADIRHRSHKFRWLGKLPGNEQHRFLAELSALMTQLPITVLACVINRPGYHNRYFEKHGRERWSLCKTAFSIAVERAAKFARHKGLRLRVLVENSDKKTERALQGYYGDLRANGLPFNPETSAQYAPLEAKVLQHTLLEFKVKTKESRLMQIADLALWPVCKGGFDTANKAYQVLIESGKVLDAHCTSENGLQGVKYSCFDNKGQENQKPA